MNKLMPQSPPLSPSPFSLIHLLAAMVNKERRQLMGISLSPLFLLGFLAIALVHFFWVRSWFSRNLADLRPFFEGLPLLLVFLASAMTMRAWSEEKSRATDSFLFTLPLPLSVLVLGKFLAQWQWLAIALILTLPLPLSLHFFVTPLDWGPIFGGYFATLLLGAMLIALGLWVSALTTNSMTALLWSLLLGALIYLIGAPILTDVVSVSTAEWMRAVGSGARFSSIARGVLDLSDLMYYASACGCFLVLLAYTLHHQPWSEKKGKASHRQSRMIFALMLANVLAINLWGALIPWRFDLTDERRFTMSEVSRATLLDLPAPLLIRAYFSERTHPLITPLQSQLRDALIELSAINPRAIRFETINPQTDPILEEEALSRFDIRPLPFRVADRYQASVVSGYFHVLVQMGEYHRVLGVSELLDIKAPIGQAPEVVLRNPEYTILRAINALSQKIGAHAPAPKIALYAPSRPSEPMNDWQIANDSATLSFTHLSAQINEDYRVEPLSSWNELRLNHFDGLILIAPRNLPPSALNAVDEFFRQGKTVVVFTSPYQPMSTPTNLAIQTQRSSLESWLAGKGLRLGEGLILDTRNGLFPTMVQRETANGLQVPTMVVAPYPYFIAPSAPSSESLGRLSAGLTDLFVPWASPIEIVPTKGYATQPLLVSSDQSWLSSQLDIVPTIDDKGQALFPPAQGRRQSYVMATHTTAQPEQGGGTLIVIAVNALGSDAQLDWQSVVEGRAVRAPINFLLNVLDHALGRSDWVNMRARSWLGHYLPPLTESHKRWVEWGNYGMALLGVALLTLLFHRRRQRRAHKLLRQLAQPH